VRIEFLKEQLVVTGEDSPMANLMLSVMGAFAESERALIGERQREGITLAKDTRSLPRTQESTLAARQANCGTGPAPLNRKAAEQKTGLAIEFSISRETPYQYLKTGS
jgi:DNA invertase Pin-like site-specific DNA recombinase